MTTQWESQFKPVIDAGSVSGRPVSSRPQQAQLGQAIIDAIKNRSHLIAECPTGTGKSLGALVPIINAIHKNPEFRAVISTETLALQDQYIKKDLPFLHSVYGRFKFSVLKGRSHYFCLDHARSNSRGNQKAAELTKQISAVMASIGYGEKADVEKRLGKKISDYDWSFISGSMSFCNDNGCDTKSCYAMKARARALESNIVVINHAILQIDTDMKQGSALVGDGMVGVYDALIVDEAHTLEQVLVDGLTESINAWEMQELAASVAKGFEKGLAFTSATPGLGYRIQEMIDDLDLVLKHTLNFFSTKNGDNDWDQLSVALCEQRVLAPSPQVLRAMDVYESEVPKALDRILATLADARVFVQKALGIAVDNNLAGRRDLRKGVRAIKTLETLCMTMLASSSTRDGQVMLYGVPYVVVLDGYTSRKNERKIRLRTVPLDVSKYASEIWKGHASVLLSATLTDLTDGTFNYVAASLGFPEHVQLKTASPFDYAVQQRVYITPANRPVVSETARAQYSFDELVDLINATKGRALVLFTAKTELEECAAWLRKLKAAGHFDWPILVQERGVDKQDLVNEFTSNTHSVLLASKSFFTGVDFAGEACSLVVLCKFPLPRFDVVCRSQVAWWRSRGYSRWYERETLTVFAQSAGRLIRTNGDHGVVAILDQRVSRASERVFKTAKIGVTALGSPVIRSVDDVKQFIDK